MLFVSHWDFSLLPVSETQQEVSRKLFKVKEFFIYFLTVVTVSPLENFSSPPVLETTIIFSIFCHFPVLVKWGTQGDIFSGDNCLWGDFPKHCKTLHQFPIHNFFWGGRRLFSIRKTLFFFIFDSAREGKNCLFFFV